MRTLFVSTLFLFVSAAAPDISTSGHGSSSRIVDDPLRWDDLVVRGIIEAIAYESIPAEEWYSPAYRRYPDESVRVAKIAISVKQVLRGKVDGAEIVLYARPPKEIQRELTFNQRVTPGAEIVATGLFKLERAAYVMHSVFAKSDEGWLRLGEAGWGSPITQKEVEDRVGSVSVPTMTRESDLVVRGTIVSGEDVGDPGSSHREYVVHVDKVFKGSQTGNIRLSANESIGATDEEWRLMLPFTLDIGTSWYLFLTKVGEAYMPTAGRRSAIKVSGNDLLENLNVPSGHSVSGLEAEVRQFSHE